MHAVVVEVNIADPEATINVLREQIVPRVKEAPGFVAGYWTRKDNSGLSMVIFESEDQANTMSEQVRSMLPEGVEAQRIEVREVTAHA